ncbi:pca operon transcription factor PcaQ [Amaricoccus sp.]|uniref:pca operon transcription factor PcaQ n=1 Tax=Amaricoccus sp. TaxID=1872485 RepID=UPI001B466C9C|nr:pca operon transcription factor PcaQ [Amaricoccus sp.]MBP7000267.1 pca operon transcription factor PcaQ [Amaricoccus sp.]
MNAIGYRHLRAFIAVARHDSVGQAAEALAISQPAVSKTLRELEDRLGVALFDRIGRRLRLTEAGRLFRKHAGQSLIELERGVHALAEPARRRGRIAVGVLPTVATRIMPRAALAFAAATPGGALTVVTGANRHLLSQLRDGMLELVVGRLAEPAAMTGLVFEQLYVEPVVAVVRPGHPLAGAASPRFGDFPLVLPPPDAVIRPAVAQYFLSLGEEPPEAFVETVSLAVGRGLALASDAVWFISRGVVAEELDRGDLVALDLRGPPVTAGPVGLTRRAGAEPSADVQSLMRALRAAAAG